MGTAWVVGARLDILRIVEDELNTHRVIEESNLVTFRHVRGDMIMDTGAGVNLGMLSLFTRALRFMIKFSTYCVCCVSRNSCKSDLKLTFRLGTLQVDFCVQGSRLTLLFLRQSLPNRNCPNPISCQAP